MDRKTIREYTHKVTNFLSLENNAYKQWVFRYTFLELEKDLSGRGDVTTNILFKDFSKVNAVVVAKSDAVLAGIAEIKYFLVDADPNFRPSLKGGFEVDFKFQDGDLVQEGDVIMEIKAYSHDILAVERTVLNLLMRMSGVATFIREVVEKVKDYDALVCPTRKTLWGLIDKKAVLVGGGGTHRMNLADAILIKDTHLDIIGRDFDVVFERLSAANVDSRFIEIEVENKEEALKCAEGFAKFLDGSSSKTIGVIMLDNMSPNEISDTIAALKVAGLYENLLFEASGGIDEDNVVEYAKSGVDILSMGCLTNGVRSVDMSLKIG
ncbi:nicotinate-nucleotide diphosphorylase (carboxylating) [Candidatus Peregrinibacteria bacterium CG_4_10_14_0_2_um_filter_38_24]|nr:MAG: nicotinate-nucleotide diphosphorylase (carboxylating) [Candidatus Peregrinibacteria bacterium CG_4_10_14_0_2_um_filter_38_24]